MHKFNMTTTKISVSLYLTSGFIHSAIAALSNNMWEKNLLGPILWLVQMCFIYCAVHNKGIEFSLTRVSGQDYVWAYTGNNSLKNK